MKITIIDIYTVDYGDLNLSPLKELGDVTFYGALDTEGILKAAKDSEAIIVNKADVNREVIYGLRNLKYAGTFSTGYNNVDLKACSERGVAVCNVPGYSTNAVSQHAFALLLSFVNKTYKYIPSVAQGDWVKSPTFCYAPWATAELCGKTFGVYGYGAIGSRTARIAEAFGMRVLVHSKSRHADCPYAQVSAEELFKESDVLSLHCPLNAETREIINERTLSLMKRDAVIINTARGGLINEGALAEALNSGRIGGACLDTLSVEPPAAGNPLLGAKNCVITPHVAWVPRETRQRLVEAVAKNLRAFQNGETLNRIL